MTLGRTFKFSQYMHINVGIKNMLNNFCFVTSLRVKGQMNESLQFFVRTTDARDLKLLGMIDLYVNLCLTTFGGWRSTG